MNKPLLILFILIGAPAFGQNLIYNGDFEEYSECPIGYSDQTQNPPEIEKCLGWTHPTHGTSDFLHQCANGTNAGINSNTIGYQEPYSGNGYLGGFATSYSGGIMWWEYIQGMFNEPLISGHIYRISFYVSLGEYSDLMINELGAYISVDAISSINTNALNVEPQLVFYKEDYFDDTINWMFVEGEYVATGGEKYLTIGNFLDNIDTDTVRRYALDGDWDLNPLATYLFYDKIEMLDVTDSLISNIPNVFTPNGDGNNDEWYVSFSLKNYEIEIFNRWGNKIITLNEDYPKWDGNLPSGVPVSSGTYFYVIIHREDKKKVKQGFVQVIR